MSDVLAHLAVASRAWAGSGAQAAPPSPGEMASIEIVRVPDQLLIRLSLVNLIEIEGTPTTLLRADAALPAFIVVQLPPQHMAERSFLEVLDNQGRQLPPPATESLALPAASRLAGPTRLAFRLPDDIPPVPVTLASLLDWAHWTPSLVPAAVAPNAPADELAGDRALRAPATFETLIELPYRLALSPLPGAGWRHAAAAVRRGGRVELWHTRLATGTAERPAGRARAVWSPDAGAGVPGVPPFVDTLRSPPTAADRREIVEKSADLALDLPLADRAIEVDRLMLSSTGGWLTAKGGWDPAVGGSLSSWTHRAVEGRDAFVETVREGVMFPFGHRAAVVVVAERKAEVPAGGGGPVAALRRRVWVIVRELLRSYPQAGYPHAGREFPLRAGVRFMQAVSPTIDAPTASSFLITRSGAPLLFALEGTDADGRPVPFRAACVFVDRGDLAIGAAALVPRIAARYTGVADRAPVDGHRLAFAASAPGQPGGPTDLAPEALTLRARVGGPAPGFMPELASATVAIPAIAELTGDRTPVAIELDPVYLAVGFEPNANRMEAFARLRGPAALGFPPDRAGGLAAPNLAVTGLSRLRGPLSGSPADLDALAAGTFDPAAFFPADATLLGGVKLSDLVAAAFSPEQVPRIVTEIEPAGAPTPEVVRTTVEWRPAVESRTPVLQSRPGTETTLVVRTQRVRRLAGAPAAGDAGGVHAELRDFVLSLAEVIELEFEVLECDLPEGGKPHVSARLAPDGVRFVNALSFVEELRTLIPLDGFEDPPALDLTPEGLRVGYGLTLPPTAVGVFALQDLGFSAALHLPFTGAPARLRLAFSEREHPALLTVSFLGGGAFLALDVGADGIEAIEGALEFGGAFSIDIGVASGGVSIMAGIYFRYERVPSERLDLGGYVRAGGSLSVLGLVTISVEFLLKLQYTAGGPDDGKVQGDALLRVKVDLTLFSTSVSLHLHRGFGGRSGDPTLVDLVPSQSVWDDYVAAFAA